MTEFCTHCGSARIETGPPIWEDYCSNPDCHGDRDEFWAQIRKTRDAYRKKKENTIFYLASIYQCLQAYERTFETGPTLATEIVGDNLNWLDNYIDELKEQYRLEGNSLRKE